MIVLDFSKELSSAFSVIGIGKYMQKILFPYTKHNYVPISKGITPLNPYLKRTMFTSKSTADFAMQTPFKVRSTQEDTSWYGTYHFIAHLTLKE